MRRLFVFLLTATALAQSPKPDDALLNALLKVRTFHQVSISPDGKRVAWSTHAIRKLEHRRDIARLLVQWFDAHLR